MRPCSFSLFLAVWNQIQGLQTPHVHFKIAEWLQESWDVGDRRLLLMAFRACGKSTLVGLFVAWLLYRDPNLRIMILSAESQLASKMVSNIRRIVERHPFTQHLKPRVPEQWSGDRFTVIRDRELRDPSVLARGVSANITGTRADVIICDDVEVPNTCSTADKRAQLREILDETNFILVPDGTILYVGTPHSYYSIYADTPRAEIGEEASYLQGYKRLLVPILNIRGESAWPERYSEEDIFQQKQKAGPHKFKSQMMLEPVNILEGRLDPSQLQFYNEDIAYKEIHKKPVLFIGEQEMVSASAWWDPSFGGRGNDHSVMAIIYSDDRGNKYIHNVSYIKISENSDLDEATQQCQKVVTLIKQYFLPSIAIEINGIGRFLPSILRKELGLAGVSCAVKELSSRTNKDIRILEAFDAPMAAQALFVHRDVVKTPFVNEMQEWQPGTSKGHDDGLDAVAGALSLEPDRIKRVYSASMRVWGRNQQTHKAKTIIE